MISAGCDTFVGLPFETFITVATMLVVGRLRLASCRRVIITGVRIAQTNKKIDVANAQRRQWTSQSIARSSSPTATSRPIILSERPFQTAIGVVLFSSSAIAIATIAATPTTSTCQSGQRKGAVTKPPRFGRSVRYLSRNASETDASVHKDAEDKTSSVPQQPHESDDREHCPLCQKYSQGPCGDLFVQWLDCTDAHPGVNPKTKVEFHLEHCQHLGEPLAECLRQHETYYQNASRISLQEDDTEVGEEEATNTSGNESDDDSLLRDDWEDVIQKIEASKSKRPFPSAITPHSELRPSTSTGMVAFSYEHEGRPLILAYVKDDAAADTLLAAGSYQDLWEWKDNLGILRLQVSPETTTSLSMYALYEAEQEADEVLFVHSERVPTTSGVAAGR